MLEHISGATCILCNVSEDIVNSCADVQASSREGGMPACSRSESISDQLATAASRFGNPARVGGGRGGLRLPGQAASDM